MRKAILAEDLRQLERNDPEIPAYQIDSLTDDEIIESYITCGECGEQALPVEELPAFIASCTTTEEFVDRIVQLHHGEEIDSDPVDEKFYIKVTGYDLDKEQKICDAVEVASAGTMQIQKDGSALVLGCHSASDENVFFAFFETLPHVVCWANAGPCNVLTIFADNELNVKIRFPQKMFTVTAEERSRLDSHKYHSDFIDLIDRYGKIVKNNSKFSEIMNEFEEISSLDFVVPDEASVSRLPGNESNESFVDFEWCMPLENEPEEVVNWSKEDIDFSNGYFQADVKVTIFSYNKARTKHIRKSLKNLIDDMKFSVNDTEKGSVLEMTGDMRIPMDVPCREYAAQILSGRIQQQNGLECMSSVELGVLHRTVVVPTPVLLLSQHSSNSEIVQKVNPILKSWGQSELIDDGSVEASFEHENDCEMIRLVFDFCEDGPEDKNLN